jgi:hypothetical protein
MATDRSVFHVVPNASADQWAISKENDDSSDGNMEYESTYGQDPSRTPS